MQTPQYVRAVYDPQSGKYVSVQAEWRNDEPNLEYYIDAAEDDWEGTIWAGAVYKFWYDENDEFQAERFEFQKYPSEAAFNADFEQIREEARSTANRDNIDEFLAVLDILKQRAIDNGFADEAIAELEGVFQEGPQDAYTLMDIGDEPRLHHHVERDDECWRLHTAQVVDQEDKPLGWGLFVVHYPDLGREASATDLQTAEDAEVLLLDQLQSKSLALLAKSSYLKYMEAERMEDPYFAYSNDTEVFEYAVLGSEWHNKDEEVVWHVYDNKALQVFLAEKQPYRLPRERWNPSKETIVDRFFKENPHPVWLEDQFRTRLDAEAGVELDEDENSPWQSLDLE